MPMAFIVGLSALAACVVLTTVGVYSWSNYRLHSDEVAPLTEATDEKPETAAPTAAQPHRADLLDTLTELRGRLASTFVIVRSRLDLTAEWVDELQQRAVVVVTAAKDVLKSLRSSSTPGPLEADTPANRKAGEREAARRAAAYRAAVREADRTIATAKRDSVRANLSKYKQVVPTASWDVSWWLRRGLPLEGPNAPKWWTYERVTTLMGSPGNELSRVWESRREYVSVEPGPLTTRRHLVVVVRWRGDSRSDSNAYMEVTFQDGVAVSKREAGLK